MMKKISSLKIVSISTGFSEIPGQISLNFFVQGCKKKCKNCHNPDLQSFDGGVEIFLEDIDDILRMHEMPTWICWLGGDAVYQPEGFKQFNKQFKILKYKICLYTGKYFDEVKDLLKDVDLVIDGPYEEDKGPVGNETTNQQVHIKIKNKWQKIKFKQIKETLESVQCI